MNARRWISLVAALCGIASQAQARDAVSRFDSGLEGWTLEGPGTIEWSPTGGSPGGCLRVTRTGSGELYLVAPAPFFGDWIGNSNSTHPRLWFNYHWAGPAAAPTRPLHYDVSGPAGTASNENLYFPLVYRNAWSAVSIYEWGSRPVFHGVAQLKIRIGVDGALPVGEVIQLDNIGQYACNPNCDRSTATPMLTANDFQCFVNAVAAGDAYAEFDGMPNGPWAEDFQTFLNAYATGCAAP